MTPKRGDTVESSLLLVTLVPFKAPFPSLAPSEGVVIPYCLILILTSSYLAPRIIFH